MIFAFFCCILGKELRRFCSACYEVQQKKVFHLSEKKVDLKAVVSETGRAAANLLEKSKRAVVNTIDQNNDGKLTMKDISLLSEK